jgi:uncharacterized protein YdeI (YjbR/CyaY-like superfamily)
MTTPPDPLLHATTREEWRAWLAEHHATASEIWLVFAKKHTGAPSVPYAAAVEEALCFGWIDSIVRRLDDERHAQKFSPRKPGSQWSASNLERVARLAAEGRMTPAGLAKVDPLAKPAERFESGSPLPEAFARALADHPLAHEHFLRLAPSYQRDYVRWVTEAKKEETRARRLAEALRLLAANQKLGLK